MKFCLPLLLAPILLASLLSAQVSPHDAETPQAARHENTASPAPATLNLRPDEKGMLSEGQMRSLLRVTADHDVENDKRQRNYTYIEREEQHNLDGKGHVKSTEVKTSEVLIIYGEQVERLIAKNDKPLSAKDAD